MRRHVAILATVFILSFMTFTVSVFSLEKFENSKWLEQEIIMEALREFNTNNIDSNVEGKLDIMGNSGLEVFSDGEVIQLLDKTDHGHVESYTLIPYKVNRK